jgi:hypothetical protein
MAKYTEIVLKTSGTRDPAYTQLHLQIIKEKYTEIVLRSFGMQAPAHAAPRGERYLDLGS